MSSCMPSRGEIASILREKCDSPATSFAASRILLTARAVRALQDQVVPELERLREKNNRSTSNYLAISRTIVKKMTAILQELVDAREGIDICDLSVRVQSLRTTANRAFVEQASRTSSLFALQLGESGEITSESLTECI